MKVRKLIIAVCSILTLGAACYGLIKQYRYRAVQREEVEKTVSEVSSLCAQEVTKHINNSISRGIAFRKRLESGKISIGSIEESLKESVNQSWVSAQEGKLFAMGVALKPKPEFLRFQNAQTAQADPKQKGLLSWYCYYSDDNAMGGREGAIVKRKTYDYTDRLLAKRTRWFTQPMDQKRPYWQEPKVSSTTNRYIAGYSLPFAFPNDEGPSGVVTINLSLRELEGVMRGPALWSKGYGVIFSDGGNIIYHPDFQMARMGIDKNPKKGRDVNMLKHIREMRSDISKVPLPFVNDNGDTFWAKSQPIKGTTWSLVTIYPEKSLLPVERSKVQAPFLLGGLGLFGLIYFLLSCRPPSNRRTWLLSVISTFLITLAIALVWSEVYKEESSMLRDINLKQEVGASTVGQSSGLQWVLEKGSPALLQNKVDVDRMKVEANALTYSIGEQKLTFVETGVLIKYIRFKSATDIHIVGYLWQKANDDGEVAGVAFPDALSGTTILDPQKTDYHFGEEGGGVYGWNLDIVLHQKFNYFRYPFDRQDLVVRMRALDKQSSPILIPDLAAYPYLWARAKPGLRGLDSENHEWEFTSSFFSRSPRPVEINLGVNELEDRDGFPDLHFTVGMRRHFLDPFISSVTPILMINAILFIVMLVSRKGGTTSYHDGTNEKTHDWTGFSALAVMSIVTGLLFSVALWHSSFRRGLEIHEFTYFECFYLLCYAQLLLVTINAVLLTSRVNVRFVEARNNLYPTVLFWPISLLAILGFTLTMLSM